MTFLKPVKFVVLCPRGVVLSLKKHKTLAMFLNSYFQANARFGFSLETVTSHVYL